MDRQGLNKLSSVIDFFQGSPDGVLLVGPDGQISQANEIAASLLGAAHAEALRGLPVEGFIPAHARAKHSAHRTSFAARPEARPMGVGLELVALRLDGTGLPIELSLTPLAAGRVLVVLRDVSERRKLLDALRASAAEARQTLETQRQILDALPANVALIDNAGRVVAVNAAWSTFARDNGAGDAAGFAVGQDYLAVCRAGAEAGAEGAAEAWHALRKLLDGSLEACSFEYPCHDQHRPRWFRASMVSLLEGGTRHAVAMHADVTERTLAEQALRRSEQSLAVIIQSIGVGVVVTNEGNRIVRMNSEAERLTEWDEAAARGELLTTVAPLTPNDDTPSPLASGLARMTLQGRSGTTRAVGVRVSPLTGATAERGTVTVISDREPEERALGERRALEARLQLADRLVSMGTLAAGIAHEINNPLALVLMNVELALEALGAPGPPAGDDGARTLIDLLKDARQGATRVRDIVDDLRSFSRVDAPRREPFDVRAAIRFAVSVTANELKHRARFVEDFEDVPLVSGDQVRIGQVFLNLLVNAFQAIPEGRAAEHEIRVIVRSAGDHVRVEVRDTGDGIDSAHLARVYDPFFTTKPTGMGTGLGLAITHAIVSEHGGEISIESTLGRGTRVTVSLAVASGATPPAPHPARPLPAIDPSRARILVVDDEAAIGRAIQRMLHPRAIVLASTGADAVARAGDERFELVLCDVMMPDLDGQEVYEQLCKVSSDYERRFVFMTGGAFTDRARAFLDGQRGNTLTKPFGRADLEAALATAFLRIDS